MFSLHGFWSAIAYLEHTWIAELWIGAYLATIWNNFGLEHIYNKVYTNFDRRLSYSTRLYLNGSLCWTNWQLVLKKDISSWTADPSPKTFRNGILHNTTIKISGSVPLDLW